VSAGPKPALRQRAASGPAGAETDRGSAERWLVLLLAILWLTVNTHRLTAASYVGASSIMADFGITAALAGLVVSAYFPVYGLFQIPVGLLVDRVSTRAILLSALALLAASNLLFALAPSVEWAILARALVGFSSAPVFLASCKICAGLSMREYPRRVGTLVTAGSFGSIVGLAGLPPLLAVLSWRETTLLLIVPLLVMFALLVVAPLPRPAGGGGQTVGVLLRGMGRGLRATRFWWLALPATAWCGAYFGVLSWLPRYARDVLGASPAWTGVLPGLFSLGLLFGGVLAGSIHTRWRWSGPWLFFGGGTCFMLLVALLPILPGLGAAGLLYGLTPAMGLLFGCFFVWMGLLSEAVPAEQLGTLTGALNGLTFLPSFVDPWLMGLLFDLVDRPTTANPTYSAAAYQAGFFFLAATMALGLAAGWLMGRRAASRLAAFEAA
jgi:predicted MFS family arabinose efflux permease